MMVYLMMDEKRNHCNFKVGYTQNLDQRMLAYATHNPEAQLIDTVVTYNKTKQQLETAIHDELIQKGLQPLVSDCGIETEWFSVQYDSELYKQITTQGLKVFNSCKNRKNTIK